jgi:hypothetical protein
MQKVTAATIANVVNIPFFMRAPPPWLIRTKQSRNPAAESTDVLKKKCLWGCPEASRSIGINAIH